jgi:GT2 family glycosyltransferase
MTGKTNNGPAIRSPRIEAMKVSILIGSRNRPASLLRCLESIAMQRYANLETIVLDDASEPALTGDTFPKPADGNRSILIMRNDTRLGLAKVRNRLLEAAQGDLLCLLDDDAYFDDPEAVQRLATAFDAHPDAGIAAFNIRDYRKSVPRSLTPHTRRQLRRDATLLERPHRASYFLGCAHALRPAVVASCGGFDECFDYGGDEIELAYRALDAGYEIVFLPDVIVHHDPPAVEKGARSEKAWRLRSLCRNRILFAYKHLPLRYAIPYAAGWSAWYGFRAVREGLLLTFARGMRDALKQVRTLERRPIHVGTIAYLKAHYGRLWY